MNTESDRCNAEPKPPTSRGWASPDQLVAGPAPTRLLTETVALLAELLSGGGQLTLSRSGRRIRAQAGWVAHITYGREDPAVGRHATQVMAFGTSPEQAIDRALREAGK